VGFPTRYCHCDRQTDSRSRQPSSHPEDLTLTGEEYFGAIEHAAERGFTSGRIYDALLLRCAGKVKADIIYTWNLKHFRMIDPRLADRIRTP
jgi:hypothetical protein